MWCKVCGRGYASEGSCYGHVYEAHPGTPKKDWLANSPIVGLTPPEHYPARWREENGDLQGKVDPETVCRTVTTAPPQHCDIKVDVDTNGAHVMTELRDAALAADAALSADKTPEPKAPPVRKPFGDRFAAPKVDLVGLPWVRMPQDEHECAEVLNLIAVAIEHAERSSTFWTSFRSHVTELQKRYRKAAA